MDVVLQDATTKRLVARARYIEQAPHGIRAKAASYLHSAATAAKSAVQRLQQNAGSIRHKAGDILFEDSNGQHAEHAEPILGTAREAASAYMASATATMKAAAQRLQHAAENALQSSSADVTLHNSNTLVS